MYRFLIVYIASLIRWSVALSIIQASQLQYSLIQMLFEFFPAQLTWSTSVITASTWIYICIYIIAVWIVKSVLRRNYNTMCTWTMMLCFLLFEEKSVWWPWHWSAGQCMEGLQLLTVCVRPDRQWQVLLHGGLWQQQGHRAYGMWGTLQGYRGKAAASWKGWGLSGKWYLLLFWLFCFSVVVVVFSGLFYCYICLWSGFEAMGWRFCSKQ